MSSVFKPRTFEIRKQGKKEYSGNYRLVSLTSIPGKVMEQLILEVSSKRGEKEGHQGQSTWIDQGEAVPGNLTASYGGMTGRVDEGSGGWCLP